MLKINVKGGMIHMCKEDNKTQKAIKEDDNMNTTAETTRDYSLSEALIASLKEVELMRKGELPKRSWNEFVEKMRKEEEEENYKE